MGFKTGSYITVKNKGLNPEISAAQTQRVSNPLSIPSGNTVSISPSFSGKSTWNFDVDGALNITSGSYVITPNKTFNVNVKMWGQGGYNSSQYSAGAGAALMGTLKLTSSQTININFGGGGTGGPASTSGDGGNYAGIFLGPSAAHANSILIAGGGGGGAQDDGGRGASGGAGGHPAGETSSGYPGTNSTGGSQSAGGGSGSGSGAALTGGTGISSSGGIGGGGGAGYYGGGGGGMICCIAGSGGGGGSSYNSPNTSLVASVTHFSGSGATAGNSSEPNRNGAGNRDNVARIYITNA